MYRSQACRIDGPREAKTRRYDEHGAIRKAAGCQGSVVFRNAANPNEVVVLLEWDKLEKAQQFTQSDELRTTMEQAGVADMPDIYFLNEVDRTTQ